MFERRRALDARAREIVEESGVLWAVARDQAKAELEEGPIPDVQADERPAVTAIVIAVIAAALLVPVFFALASVVVVDCGGFATVGPYDIPCERRADNGLVAWLVVSATGFVASAVLALSRRQPGWMVVPVAVGVCAAIAVGVALVAVW